MNSFDYNRPNSRERVAARRRALSREGSAVTPGPRRVFSTWIVSGWIVSAALLLAALGALAYLFTSPRFSVRDLPVSGTVVMNADDVRALAAAEGQSIWFVDTKQIVARLRASSYIEDASVSVELPDRLRIAVSERRPELRWQTGGQRFLVDSQGLVLGPDTTGALTNTLVIQDLGNLPVQPHDRVDASALELGRILALRLPRELKLQPSSIGWDAQNGLSITTADRRTIIFGRNDNLDQKLSVLGYALKEGIVFTTLDLRPSTPYYRTDGGTGPSPTPAPSP